MLRSVLCSSLFGSFLSVVVLATSAPAAQTLHWEMNSPSPLEDTPGTNDLILPGGSSDPTYLPTGGYGGSGAYSFDGSNDNFQVTTSPTNLGPVDSDWTVNFWIKTTDAGTNTDVYGLKVPVLGEPNGGPIGFAIGIQSGKAAFMHYDGGWNKEMGNVTVADGAGHFVTYVHKDTGAGTGIMQFYVDGVFDASVNAHDVGPSAYNFSRVGLTYLGLYGNFTLDEVSFYNSALSADAIFAAFAPPPAPEPASSVLLLSGLLGLYAQRRRNARRV